MPILPPLRVHPGPGGWVWFAGARSIGAILVVVLLGCGEVGEGHPSFQDARPTAGGNRDGGVSRPLGALLAGAPDLARLRAGTVPYHDFTQALEAGFVEVSGHNECVAHPEGGGKGIRYVQPERFGTVAVDPTRPEILLYLPHPDGRMELVGVEFAVEAVVWHRVHGADAAPELAGVRYDPPDPEGPDPFLESAYTLSVWLWKDNPQGMFAPFNPRVRCS